MTASVDSSGISDKLQATSITEDSNPWKEPGSSKGLDTHKERALRTPDPSTLDPSITAGFSADEPREELTHLDSKEVLDEFDPLANEEEKDSRDAWGNSEGHPPPPPQPERSTSPPPPEPPQKDALPPASFPSLAALARSFSIPTLTRPRPLSLDSAKPVPSPATLSSFASQQNSPGPSRVGTPSSRRRSTDSSRAGKDRDQGGDPPFDFQKFLDQMKTRSAEPVSKYLKSFLSNFAKRTFTVADQIKIINDFLFFIAKQMRECDVWKNASDAEFDNAMEGMEKLVMNQLYQFTFTPQILRVVPRRQVTADDLERDRVLSQRIALFGWIEEKHLDIPEGEGSQGFMMFAQQELLKINHYKAPRDKLICILNCCKVIFGLIRHLQKEEGADAFVPILIFVVLKANPEHLLSNVEFINRFRNPSKLQSEAGYYLSSLMGAVSFIETMDHTSLSNISQEEFEKNVEAAIQALPPSETNTPSIPPSDPSFSYRPSSSSSSSRSEHTGEESAEPLSLPVPAPGQTLSEDAKRLIQKTGDTISKPLNALSRIFNEALDNAEGKLASFEREIANSSPSTSSQHWAHPDQMDHYRSGSFGASGLPPPPQTPAPSGGEGGYQPPIQTPYKPRVKRVPSPYGSPGWSLDDTPSRRPASATPPRLNSGFDSAHVSRTPTPNLDLAGMQAEIDTAHEQAAVAAKETLLQIFPGVDNEVVGWVLEANEGDLGKSIEALLEMSTGS